MRATPLLFIVLVSCAPARHAETFLHRGADFSGERWVYVSAPDRDLEEAFERAFRARGFRVSRSMRNVKAVLPARYVVEVRGQCPEDALMRQRSRELQVDVFDGPNMERVFAAHLDSSGDCPEAFFNEVAAALDRNWARSADGDDPDLPRR